MPISQKQNIFSAKPSSSVDKKSDSEEEVVVTDVISIPTQMPVSQEQNIFSAKPSSSVDKKSDSEEEVLVTDVVSIPTQMPVSQEQQRYSAPNAKPSSSVHKKSDYEEEVLTEINVMASSSNSSTTFIPEAKSSSRVDTHSESEEEEADNDTISIPSNLTSLPRPISEGSQLGSKPEDTSSSVDRKSDSKEGVVVTDMIPISDGFNPEHQLISTAEANVELSRNEESQQFSEEEVTTLDAVQIHKYSPDSLPSSPAKWNLNPDARDTMPASPKRENNFEEKVMVADGAFVQNNSNVDDMQIYSREHDGFEEDIANVANSSREATSIEDIENNISKYYIESEDVLPTASDEKSVMKIERLSDQQVVLETSIPVLDSSINASSLDSIKQLKPDSEEKFSDDSNDTPSSGNKRDLTEIEKYTDVENNSQTNRDEVQANNVSNPLERVSINARTEAERESSSEEEIIITEYIPHFSLYNVENANLSSPQAEEDSRQTETVLEVLDVNGDNLSENVANKGYAPTRMVESDPEEETISQVEVTKNTFEERRELDEMSLAPTAQENEIPKDLVTIKKASFSSTENEEKIKEDDSDDGKINTKLPALSVDAPDKPNESNFDSPVNEENIAPQSKVPRNEETMKPVTENISFQQIGEEETRLGITDDPPVFTEETVENITLSQETCSTSSALRDTGDVFIGRSSSDCARKSNSAEIESASVEEASNDAHASIRETSNWKGENEERTRKDKICEEKKHLSEEISGDDFKENVNLTNTDTIPISDKDSEVPENVASSLPSKHTGKDDVPALNTSTQVSNDPSQEEENDSKGITDPEESTVVPPTKEEERSCSEDGTRVKETEEGSFKLDFDVHSSPNPSAKEVSDSTEDKTENDEKGISTKKDIESGFNEEAPVEPAMSSKKAKDSQEDILHDAKSSSSIGFGLNRSLKTNQEIADRNQILQAHTADMQVSNNSYAQTETGPVFEQGEVGEKIHPEETSAGILPSGDTIFALPYHLASDQPSHREDNFAGVPSPLQFSTDTKIKPVTSMKYLRDKMKLNLNPQSL
ncbi:hypothetical protein EGW08_005677 [Elysia chlorotica]|uniref:Uncharacterized protein n=1 Tax=Elysia chlorotica TaxID=188477 RepID=A0A3S1BEK3_ELYCH|nr:hypothetical protein EGW08_005677 [Elysia chlorotica]